MLYAVTIFIGSFLLFQVEPLIGRYILPWYGGGPAVWTTCMLFFQVVLLAGYGYAHLVTLLERKKQGYLHLALLIAALAFLPIAPSPEYWKPGPGDEPALKILLLLLANVGLPYLILSATAPLLQHWFALSYPRRSPYRLYALSNLGSLLALLSYPFLVEPNLILNRQVTLWSWAFALFACACATCAVVWKAGRAGGSAIPGSVEPGREESEGDIGREGQRIPLSSLVQWLLLSAFGSVMLLATTNLLCQDIAVIPFLWVMPLVLYLATFAIAFNSDKAAGRLVWALLMAASFIAAGYQLTQHHGNNLVLQILIYLAALFTCCMSCHGELARSRPDPRHLTRYYLVISVGGALGGLFVAIIAPLVFSDFWEYPLALAGSMLVLMMAWRRAGAFRKAPRFAQACGWLFQLGICGFVAYHIYMTQNGSLASFRNFYGVIKLYRNVDQAGKRLVLLHGHIMHGWQYEGGLKRLPTAYYGPESGAGLALTYHPRRFAQDPRERALHVGVIGLGTGTLATYGQPGDTMKFYEINPDVISVAQRNFTFCRDSAAKVEYVSGDARIMLERELKENRPEKFDLLMVDAFTGDAIPIHLLTRECFGIYRRHLKPDGLLLIHITNRFVDLAPVVRSEGKAAGYLPVTFTSESNQAQGTYKSDWIALIPDLAFLGTSVEVGARADIRSGANEPPVIWTDDFASLWHVIKRKTFF